MAIIKIVEKPHIEDVIKEISKKYDIGMIESLERHAFNKWFVRLEPKLKEVL